ncbi:MAG: trypsin-like peptidase domain-containing protein [Saprospiraceae bacterium]|nr:trypsin-like peptidase domain-containing protein [Saprospiraceae bacterium]
MIKFHLILLNLLLVNISNGQSYMTSEILNKVFKISLDTTSNQTATGFLVEDNGEIFMVTARHVFPSTFLSNIKSRIYVKEDNKWNYMDGTLFHHNNSKVDISIIRVFEGQKTSIKNDFNLSYKNLIYGDEGYILGFPYNLSTDIWDREFPLPLIKRVINSGTIIEDGIQLIFLDGHNNPGFSGGPIVFKNHSKSNGHMWQIVGVISAYVTQNNDLITPLGKMKYHENSGIVIGYSSDHIKAIINQTR